MRISHALKDLRWCIRFFVIRSSARKFQYPYHISLQISLRDESPSWRALGWWPFQMQNSGSLKTFKDSDFRKSTWLRPHKLSNSFSHHLIWASHDYGSEIFFLRRTDIEQILFKKFMTWRIIVEADAQQLLNSGWKVLAWPLKIILITNTNIKI